MTRPDGAKREEVAVADRPVSRPYADASDDSLDALAQSAAHMLRSAESRLKLVREELNRRAVERDRTYGERVAEEALADSEGKLVRIQSAARKNFYTCFLLGEYESAEGCVKHLRAAIAEHIDAARRDAFEQAATVVDCVPCGTGCRELVAAIRKMK